jgi:hypothetical protein
VDLAREAVGVDRGDDAGDGVDEGGDAERAIEVADHLDAAARALDRIEDDRASLASEGGGWGGVRPAVAVRCGQFVVVGSRVVRTDHPGHRRTGTPPADRLAATAAGAGRHPRDRATAGSRLPSTPRPGGCRRGSVQTVDHSRRLLENRSRNAVEHGRPDATVRPVLPDDGFAVEDDGIGIPEADRERAFEAGYSTTAGGSGFGLAIVGFGLAIVGFGLAIVGFGLAIVETIARAHGWSVSVAGGRDGGTRFEFSNVAVLG